jgi:peptidoglycan/xylan/chitin deacetylase (PgdA/CDA1 family)
MRAWTRAAVVLGAAALADALPSVASVRSLRLAALPGLTGLSAGGHVAMTIDDGPDPKTTPRFLELFAEAGVRATFFVLGERLQRRPEYAQELLAAGHEIAVHGWIHRPHLLRLPTEVASDIARSRHYVADLTGRPPRFWRPPHGIPTGTGLATAWRLGMAPVLWSADGRDWEASATAASVAARIRCQLDAGGVILLHDGAGPGGASHAAIGAVPTIVEWCRERGWVIGPLSEHGVRARGIGDSGRTVG